MSPLGLEGSPANVAGWWWQRVGGCWPVMGEGGWAEQGWGIAVIVYQSQISVTTVIGDGAE